VSGASVEGVDEELSLFMDLIRQTDDAVQDAPATRGGGDAMPLPGTSDAGWQHFYKLVKGKKVKATRVIDFVYNFDHKLQPQFNETVERMYCFDDGGSSRVVLHVHTLEQWPGFAKALAGDPLTRARTVTSVNIRHATLNPKKTGPKFLSERQGYPVVGVGNWKSLVSKARGGETEWRWGARGDVPKCQRQMGADWKVAYDEVRSEASLCLPFLNPLESDSTTGSARHS